MSTWGPRDLIGESRLLAAADEVVEQHTDPAFGPGRSSSSTRPGDRRRRGVRRRRLRCAGRRPRPAPRARRRARPRRGCGRRGRPVPVRPRPRGCPTRCAPSRGARAAMRRCRCSLGRGGHDEPHRGAVDRETAGLVRESPLQPGLPAQYDLITVERRRRRPRNRSAVQHPGPGVASTGGNDAARFRRFDGPARMPFRGGGAERMALTVPAVGRIAASWLSCSMPTRIQPLPPTSTTRRRTPHRRTSRRAPEHRGDDLRHPDLFGPFASFTGTLTLSGRLDPQPRAARASTAVRCGCDYEWGQRTASARAANILDSADIARMLEGRAFRRMVAPRHRAAGRARQLHTHDCVSDRTWAALHKHWTSRRLMEVPMLVGLYTWSASSAARSALSRSPARPCSVNSGRPAATRARSSASATPPTHGGPTVRRWSCTSKRRSLAIAEAGLHPREHRRGDATGDGRARAPRSSW